MKFGNDYGGFSVNTEIDEVQNLKKPQEKFSKKKEFFEWCDVVAIALITVIILFGFIFRIATISGDSMLNTLHNGEMVVISDLFYKAKHGDIVVISRNIENAVSNGYDTENGPIIKRVIATENQTVDIDFDTGIVYVDGVALSEDYISTPTRNSGDVKFPVTVPEGHIFVLGDNRRVSLDSRYSTIGENGMVDERYILGHAVYRILPFKKAGRLDNK